MTEPTPQNNPNLDSLTRLTLEVIEIKKNLENLTKRWLENDVSLMTELREWENRVKVLEEARVEQRKLNPTFVQKTETKSETSNGSKKSFWDRFK